MNLVTPRVVSTQGQLSMAPFLRLSPHHLRPLIARIVGRFDCRRVSQFLLEELDRRVRAPAAG